MTICKDEQNFTGECQIMYIHFKEEFLGEKYVSQTKHTSA